MAPSRREMLHRFGLLTPAFLLGMNPFGLFRSLFSPKGDVGVWRRPPPNPFIKDGKVLVSVVRGEDVDHMVREAVKLIGGLDRLSVRGKTVLVKPNVLSGEPPPATTNPEAVRSVVRLFREAGAKRVIVGDMSAMMRLPTSKNLERTGIARAAREAGAEVIDFDDAEWIELKPPGAWLTPSIHIARPVYEADLFVNVPVVKTHRNAVYSICLKNLVGVTHPRHRPYRVNPAKWEEVIAELNLAVHPILNIVDATTIMVADGPWEGPSEKTNLIMASGDRIAADVTGLALIKHFNKWEGVSKIGVWEQRQIKHARDVGLGMQDQTQFQLRPALLHGDRHQFDALVAALWKEVRV
ncbi:MAG: DUF362 domain-containing protein [Nitrospirae bacterium]|nr:DUF362 domain-containing protein [Nitrospirota bacterium]